MKLRKVFRKDVFTICDYCLVEIQDLILRAKRTMLMMMNDVSDPKYFGDHLSMFFSAVHYRVFLLSFLPTS